MTKPTKKQQETAQDVWRSAASTGNEKQIHFAQTTGAFVQEATGINHEAIVRVTTKIEGFRRGGIAHYGTVEYPPDTLTPEQISQLQDEPNLVVDIVSRAVQPPETENPDAGDEAGSPPAENEKAAENEKD